MQKKAKKNINDTQQIAYLTYQNFKKNRQCNKRYYIGIIDKKTNISTC